MLGWRPGWQARRCPGWRWAMAALRQPRMTASAADRQRAVASLQESFIEGRLSRDEFGQRLGQAIVSRDFRELLALTADLPVRGPFDRLPSHRTVPTRPSRGQRSPRWLARVTARLKRGPGPNGG